MTEDEAKTKWCPFVQVSAACADSYPGAYSNRSPQDATPNIQTHIARNCIGSECMAWRFYPKDQRIDPKHKLEPVGYCGLAGK